MKFSRFPISLGIGALLLLVACAVPPSNGAISYSPYRDGQHPGQGSPSVEEIREDLHILAAHWSQLRTYGSEESGEIMLRIIREDELDLKVMLGVWIADEAPDANRAELNSAIDLANRYPEVVQSISVGNETQVYWSGHKSSVDSLIQYIRLVKTQVDVPVTSADDYNFWNKPESEALSREVDFITLHAHPLWNGIQRENALAWLEEQTEIVEDLHPGKQVILGETGWATNVHDEGEQAELIKGAATETEQLRFYREVGSWAKATDRTVYWFEAFDERWKGGSHPNEVEKHWGLYFPDRSPKQAMQLVQRAARPHSIQTLANVEVSDGTIFTVETLYLSPDHTVARWDHGDRIETYGVVGDSIWTHSGGLEKAAPPMAADFVRGHQVHAMVLLFEDLHKRGEMLWVADYEPSGRLNAFSTELPGGASIRMTLEDWREVEGHQLPFRVLIDDGSRTFEYLYESVELNEGRLGEFRGLVPEDED